MEPREPKPGYKGWMTLSTSHLDYMVTIVTAYYEFRDLKARYRIWLHIFIPEKLGEFSHQNGVTGSFTGT